MSNQQHAGEDGQPGLGDTITALDADFLGRVHDIESRAGLYLRGPDRARARRMLALDMVAGGRLDPERYAVLTPKGQAFVANMRKDSNW